MSEPIKSQNDTATQCLCEFSNHPFDDCYCCNVTGRSALKIATYCMDRYWDCPIYRERSGVKKQQE